MEIITYINGIEVNQPNNLKEIKLLVNVTEEGDKVVSFDGTLDWGRGDLRYFNDAYNLLNGYAKQGLLGGVGVAEAPRVQIYAKEFNRQIKVLDALVDLWDAEFDEEHRTINTPIIQTGGQDWIADNTKGLSFEYLASIGVITPNDFILSPYVIEKNDQSLEVAILLTTTLVVVTQIRTQIQEIIEISADASGVQPWVAVAKISVRISYIILLTKTLIDTLIRVINLLIQPVKYMCGMTVYRHFEVMFNHLGYSFQSSLFSGDEKYLTLFPERYTNPKNKDLDDIKGWIIPNKKKQLGYYKGYCYQFIQAFKQYYNAKFIIDQDNKVIKFERKDYTEKIANFSEPAIWQKQKYNKKDFFANHLVEFQTDINDRHTIQEYYGTSSQVNISINGTFNPERNLLSGGKQISIPFSLLKVKTELSTIENILKTLLKVVETSLNSLVTVLNAVIKSINAVLKVINKIIKALSAIGIKLNVNIKPIPTVPKFKLSDVITNRVGIFKMEDDIVYVPKLAYVKNTGNEKNNKQFKELRAADIQENYHSIDFFTRGNQYIQGEGFGIAINFDQIYDIINADKMQDGSELVSLQWSLMDHTADIILKKPFTYLNALQESKIEANGN